MNDKNFEQAHDMAFLTTLVARFGFCVHSAFTRHMTFHAAYNHEENQWASQLVEAKELTIVAVLEIIGNDAVRNQKPFLA
jgi:hypothetical protein